ncbi:MAG TPA: methyltransferase domain-containing protein [Campylobacterales bacterium]|nr:methyltransferase domain-containing protein [Campylobacterales bacterium]
MFLYQPTKGYAYNSDSIFLYNFISTFTPRGKLLDVGCGVGIISLLLSRDFNIETSIIDKQKIMLQYAQKNYTINKLEAKAYLGDFIHTKIDEQFDFIVSNPPFYNTISQSENEHLNIARYAHHLPIDDFIKKVKSILRPRGRFIFCYDAKQIDILLYTLIKYKINPETVRFVHSKIDRESKLVMISARMNSKSMMKVLSPLIVFDKDSNYNYEAKEAFIKASTNSIKGDCDI